MAANGNLNARDSYENGRTESDATHFRLRNDLHSTEYITCLSCGQNFECTSVLQIYEHYSERSHQVSYASCLYCQGKVHEFCRANSSCIEVYHNCLRWKRGEDR